MTLGEYFKKSINRIEITELKIFIEENSDFDFNKSDSEIMKILKDNSTKVGAYYIVVDEYESMNNVYGKGNW